MSKKTFFFIIIFIAILGGIAFYYFYSKNNRSNTVPTVDQTNLFPFGSPQMDGTGASGTGQNNQDDEIFTTGNLPRLRKLSSEPVAGSTIFDRDGRQIVRYVDRAKGNVYEAYGDNAGQVRISNATIPKIQKAIWGNNGNNVLLQYLKDNSDEIESFSLQIPTASSTQDILGKASGVFLAKNIYAVDSLDGSTKLFYLTKNDTGSAGTVAKFDNTSKINTFNSQAIEWLVSWPKESVVTLTSKPSVMSGGFMYFLNTKTGLLTKQISNIAALTTITNSDASKVLFSGKTSSGMALYVLDVKSGTSRRVSFNTFTDKCVWGKKNPLIAYCAVPVNDLSGDYPEIWYQGIISTADNIWQLNSETGAVDEIAELSKLSGTSIDVFGLEISSDDSLIAFQNKNDLDLWLLSTSR